MANIIKASDLIQQVLIPLHEGWGYIWGTYGQLWTATSKITNKAPDNSKAQAVKYGNQWIGKHVTDCSGLLYWAAKELGGYIPHGANTIYNQCKQKGKVTSNMSLSPGSAVFLYDGKTRHHVGLYIGHDTVVEAKGTQWGVVTSKLSHWDEWGTIKNVNYEGGEAVEVQQPTIKPTLRKGSVGPDVTRLQELLIAHGYAIAVDGAFGSSTLAALKGFQQHVGIEADGICGPVTWAALQTKAPEDQPPEGDADQDEVPKHPAWQETLRELREELDAHAEMIERMKVMVEAMMMEGEADDVG